MHHKRLAITVILIAIGYIIFMVTLPWWNYQYITVSNIKGDLNLLNSPMLEARFAPEGVESDITYKGYWDENAFQYLTRDPHTDLSQRLSSLNDIYQNYPLTQRPDLNQKRGMIGGQLWASTFYPESREVELHFTVTDYTQDNYQEIHYATKRSESVALIEAQQIKDRYYVLYYQDELRLLTLDATKGTTLTDQIIPLPKELEVAQRPFDLAKSPTSDIVLYLGKLSQHNSGVSHPMDGSSELSYEYHDLWDTQAYRLDVTTLSLIPMDLVASAESFYHLDGTILYEFEHTETEEWALRTRSYPDLTVESEDTFPRLDSFLIWDHHRYLIETTDDPQVRHLQVVNLKTEEISLEADFRLQEEFEWESLSLISLITSS